MRIGCVVKIVRRIVSGYYWSRFQQTERHSIDLGFRLARLESDLIEAKIRIEALEEALVKRRPGRPRKAPSAPEGQG